MVLVSQDLISDALEQLVDELRHNDKISAAAVFGSFSTKKMWLHSDVDLFVITKEDGELRGASYLRRKGLLLHLQLLSDQSLKQLISRPRGSAFFTALSSCTVLFDKSGVLSTAVSNARLLNSPGSDHRACVELCGAVDDLNSAEKAYHHGCTMDAKSKAQQALEHLAAARLAKHSIYPPREIWAHPSVQGAPETSIQRGLWSATDIQPLIDGFWGLLRDMYPEYMQPLMGIIRDRSPIPWREMIGSPAMMGIEVGERLVHELVGYGLITERSVFYPELGFDELAFEVADHVRRDE